MLGGAGNVARSIVALGGKAILVGVLGDDDAGDRIVGHLTEQNRVEGMFVRVAGHPTTVKTRYISGGQQIMRLDIEKKLDLDELRMSEICRLFAKVADGIDVVVLSDYAKG